MATTATAPTTKSWGGGKSPFNVEYGKVMMWYFLMSDAFTFGAFLISYGTIRFSTMDGLTPMKYLRVFLLLQRA
jgi:cytochrome c oxidase subunit 3